MEGQEDQYTPIYFVVKGEGQDTIYVGYNGGVDISVVPSLPKIPSDKHVWVDKPINGILFDEKSARQVIQEFNEGRMKLAGYI